MSASNVISITRERRNPPTRHVPAPPRLIRLDRQGPVLVVLRPDREIPALAGGFGPISGLRRILQRVWTLGSR